MAKMEAIAVSKRRQRLQWYERVCGREREQDIRILAEMGVQRKRKAEKEMV